MGTEDLESGTLPCPVFRPLLDKYSLDRFRIFTGKYFFDFLKVFPDIGHEVDRLVEVGGAERVVLDELDVVVLGDVALAVVAYAVHHGYPEVLDGPQQVLMTWIFKIEISRLL